MKKLAQLLLFLSCTSYAYDRQTMTKAAVVRKFNCSKPNHVKLNCPKCPRGHRGHKGKQGATGATGPQGATGATGPVNFTDELFINANMMASVEFNPDPDRLFDDAYDSPQSPLSAWIMVFNGEGENIIGSQYVIPNTLDRTKPVTLTIHCFNNLGTFSGGDIQLQVHADYKANGEILGSAAPQTGYAESLLTGIHTIIAAPDSTNLQYFTLSVPLDPTLMIDKTWGFLVLSANRENSTANLMYITEMSIQYTKIDG